MDSVTIRYYKGKMTIYPEKFFPCNKKTWKKLLDVIRMDFNGYQVVINDILFILKNHLSDLEEKKKDIAKNYIQKIEEKSVLNLRVESGKEPSGIPLSKKKLDEYKKNLKYVQGSITTYEKEYKRTEKRIEQIKNNIELILIS